MNKSINSMLEWKEIYSVNNKRIDEQHKNFFNLVNKLMYLDNSDIAGKKNILKELSDYADYHFSDEENFMGECKYPYLEEHHKIHEDFKKIIENLSKDTEKIKEIDLFEFASDWLIKHILNVDQLFAIWYKTNNV